MFERRLHVLLLGLGFLFGILILRFFFLQVVMGEDYYRSVMENRRQIQYFKGERGRILDRNGTVLAKNRQTRDISIIMSHILQRVRGQYKFNMIHARRMVSNLAQTMDIRETVILDKIETVFEKITRKPFVYKGETIPGHAYYGDLIIRYYSGRPLFASDPAAMKELMTTTTAGGLDYDTRRHGVGLRLCLKTD